MGCKELFCERTGGRDKSKIRILNSSRAVMRKGAFNLEKKALLASGVEENKQIADYTRKLDHLFNNS